jgi:cysteine desulfurase family protein (TIGR01976 family)
MTTLTFSVSRAIGRRLQKGDALLLTRMDHDGNIGPWLKLAEDLDLTVRWLEFDPESYEYRMEDLDGLLSSGDVKLAAINYASNCTGTINDVKTITQKVQASGGLVYVDAVQYVPHGPTDVQDLGCDFLVCSPYKFFGPHQGVLWGRLELLNQLEAYKVRPADEVAPGNFETGTQSHEGQAATLGTIDYLAWLGATMGTEFQSDFPRFSGRRLQLHAAMQALQQYEQELSSRLITGLQRFPGVVVRGLTAPADMDRRVPTVSFTAENQAPQKIAEALALQNIFVWDGHNYAVEAVRTMGLADKGGVVRVGPVHYNTVTEIDQLLNALEAILD